MLTSGFFQSPLFPLSLAAGRDRRSQPRLSAEVLGLDVDAALSQGVYVRVLNVSTGGALVELHEWIRPGTKSALKLSRPVGDDKAADRMVASGQIVRCWVDRLAPLRYRAAMVFSAPSSAPSNSPATEPDLTVPLERPA